MSAAGVHTRVDLALDLEFFATHAVPILLVLACRSFVRSCDCIRALPPADHVVSGGVANARARPIFIFLPTGHAVEMSAPSHRALPQRIHISH